jgi:hypothetical protein
VIEKLVMDCIVAVESAAIVLIYMRSVVRGRRARRALGTPGAAPDPTGEPAKASISVEVELADADLWQLARDLVSGQKYVSANRLETVERLYRRKDPKEIADVDLWGPLVTVGDRIEELKSELDKWNRLIFLTDEIASKLRRASGKK